MMYRLANRNGNSKRSRDLVKSGHETWKNDAWRTGGGGTWITGSYDPATDLLYWGVGNPSPGVRRRRAPRRQPVHRQCHRLAREHRQVGVAFPVYARTTKHDWDAAQTPVLADLPIKGVVRKVICWPNRNGFYYVLDRVTGEFLAGVAVR